jgi:hypothetical protein
VTPQCVRAITGVARRRDARCLSRPRSAREGLRARADEYRAALLWMSQRVPVGKVASMSVAPGPRLPGCILTDTPRAVSAAAMRRSALLRTESCSRLCSLDGIPVLPAVLVRHPERASVARSAAHRAGAVPPGGEGRGGRHSVDFSATCNSGESARSGLGDVEHKGSVARPTTDSLPASSAAAGKDGVGDGARCRRSSRGAGQEPLGVGADSGQRERRDRRIVGAKDAASNLRLLRSAPEKYLAHCSQRPLSRNQITFEQGKLFRSQ